VPVQGEGAAPQIAAAVRGFNALPEDGPIQRPDLLIVARGGGSIEDLWAFNEEEVVRAVAESAIPTISAVGHETDTSLCDFAADVRAPTPTAAAEMAVPVRTDLLGQLRELGHRTERCALRALERAREQLDTSLRRWPEREALLAPQRQRLDDLADRLPRALRTELSHARAALGQTAGALRPGLLRAAHARAKERLEALWRVAELAHPNRPLQRGYARVEDREGRTLISAAAARKAERLRLIFGDGDVEAQVAGAQTTGGPVERPRKAPYVKPTSEQPKLL
jgi:exodeoxyribonuclease VII large subunit